jgi:hypothetical protein
MSNIILGSDGITIRQGIYEESLVAKAELGRFIDFQDGRRFRYCRAANASIPRANMALADVPISDHINVAQTNYGVTINSKDNISIALDAAPDAKNEYAGGYLLVNDSESTATGQGYMYKIRKHDIGTAPCHMWLYDPVHVAILTTDEITLVKNKYDDLVKTPASAITAAVVGVALITVTALYYFWAQTRGYCPILVGNGAMTIGYDVGQDPNTIGACENTSSSATPYYGKAVTAGTDTEYAVVDLHLE